MNHKTSLNKALTILLNDTIGSYTLQRGIARCFQATLAALEHTYDDTHRQQVLLCSANRPPAQYKGRFEQLLHFRGSQPLGFQDFLVSRIAAREQPTLVYSPYYGRASVRAPEIFTVYDMIHERFPQYFSHRNPFVKRFIDEKKRCFERAALLLAISSATAKDVLNFYPDIDPDKIIVIPLGVESTFFNETSVAAQHTTPYFLYVGNRTLYKNFQRALIAFGESNLAGTFALQIISPTDATFTVDEQAIIHRYKLEKHLHLATNVSEHSLHGWYSNATALIYPSEYEGFGLPILEAMASGTLVATSNVSSMPEVGGDVADYFDPYSIESIAASLQRLASLSTVERSRYVANGITRARSFSWERYQERTIAAFERCLSES